VEAYAISPDGAWVAFLADARFDHLTELYLSRLDERRYGPWTLNATNPPTIVLDFKIASDSKSIIYSAVQAGKGTVEILSYEFGTGETKKLNGVPTSGAVAFWDVSADAKWVVYVADEEKAGVYELYSRKIDGSGSPIKLSGSMPETGDVQGLRISPDSRRVIYVADQDQDEVLEIYSCPIDGSASHIKLNSSLQAGRNVGRFEIAPNGSWVTYLADGDQDGVFDLYSRPADGGGPAVKLNEEIPSEGFISSFSISPDEKWVVYGIGYSDTDYMEMFSRRYRWDRSRSEPEFGSWL
jgi:6-phosphogluconolactonase (cycloisomerase 2 family)